MTTKLTLSVDAAVISRAKRYAKRSGVSVSALVENYLAVVSQPPSAPKAPPRLQELRGILKGADVSQYRKHLERKYR
jgi:Family of unknown function (DUF6364)